jgi:hypothetical protein
LEDDGDGTSPKCKSMLDGPNWSESFIVAVMAALKDIGENGVPKVLSVQLFGIVLNGLVIAARSSGPGALPKEVLVS